jgi:hypothetical protein
MNYIESKLIPLLGKGIDDPGVRQAISDLALADVDDDPEMHRRYVGADEKGIALLFQDSQLRDIQIYLEPDKYYSTFAGELPFGIRKGMSQAEIHILLGEPKKFDKFDSQYFIEAGRVRLYVGYDDALRARYLSIGLPLWD